MGFRSPRKPMYRRCERVARERLFGFQGDLNRLTCLDYSNYCIQHAFSSSTRRDAMETNSLDDFYLAPPGWSDSSLQRATTMTQIYMLPSAGVSYVKLAQTHPQYNQPYPVTSLSLSQTKM